MNDSSETNITDKDLEDGSPIPLLIANLEPRLIDHNLGFRSNLQAGDIMRKASSDSKYSHNTSLREYESSNFTPFEVRSKLLSISVANDSKEEASSGHGVSSQVNQNRNPLKYEIDSLHANSLDQSKRSSPYQSSLLNPSGKAGAKSMAILPQRMKSEKSLALGSANQFPFSTDNNFSGNNLFHLLSSPTEGTVFTQNENSLLDDPPPKASKNPFWNIRKRQTAPPKSQNNKKPLTFFTSHIVQKAISKFKRGHNPDLTNKQLELVEDFTFIKRDEIEGEVHVSRAYKIERFYEKPRFLDWFWKSCLGSWLQEKCPERFKNKKRRKLKLMGENLSCGQRCSDLIQAIKRPILPTSKFRICWDLVLLTLLLIDVIVLPMELSFNMFQDLVDFEIATDMMFMTDIFLNFHTAYMDRGNMIFDHKKIATHYLKTWFTLDLISSIPYDLIDIVQPNASVNSPIFKLFTLLRFIKVLRALRFFKVFRIFRRFKAVLQISQKARGPLQLIKLLFIVLFLAHWLACGWHLVAVLGQEIYNGMTWMDRIGLTNKSDWDQYVISLYWAITTMLTVGYGDITPVSEAEMIYCIFAILFGCGVFAFMLNTIGTIVQRMRDKVARTKKKIETMTSYMVAKDINKDIQGKLKSYAEYLLEEESEVKDEQEEFLAAIPEHMRREVLIDLNSILLTQNITFNINFGLSFLSNLSYKLQEKTLGPGDTVFLVMLVILSNIFRSQMMMSQFTLQQEEGLRYIQSETRNLQQY